MCKTCEIISCNKNARFGFPEEGVKWCSPHKKPGSIDLKNPTCKVPECYRIAYFGVFGGNREWCPKHKNEGGPHDGKPISCSKHKEEGYIDLVSPRCNHPMCNTTPCFGPEGGKPMWCAKHKREGDTNVVSWRGDTMV